MAAEGTAVREIDTIGGAALGSLLLVFLAVSFPPSVAMLRGTPRQAAVALALTLLAWVPGVIFALWLLAQAPGSPVSDRAADDAPAA